MPNKENLPLMCLKGLNYSFFKLLNYFIFLLLHSTAHIVHTCIHYQTTFYFKCCFLALMTQNTSPNLYLCLSTLVSLFVIVKQIEEKYIL